MNSLWAPWRMEYIKRDRSNPDRCIFCEKFSDEDDKKNLVLYRKNTSFILMNLFPYNNGHLLIAPKRYCTDNAVMVASLAYYKYQANLFADLTLEPVAYSE